jgi:hypothetical protein
MTDCKLDPAAFRRQLMALADAADALAARGKNEGECGPCEAPRGAHAACDSGVCGGPPCDADGCPAGPGCPDDCPLDAGDCGPCDAGCGPEVFQVVGFTARNRRDPLGRTLQVERHESLVLVVLVELGESRVAFQCGSTKKATQLAGLLYDVTEYASA